MASVNTCCTTQIIAIKLNQFRIKRFRDCLKRLENIFLSFYTEFLRSPRKKNLPKSNFFHRDEKSWIFLPFFRPWKHFSLIWKKKNYRDFSFPKMERDICKPENYLAIFFRIPCGQPKQPQLLQQYLQCHFRCRPCFHRRRPRPK